MSFPYSSEKERSVHRIIVIGPYGILSVPAKFVQNLTNFRRFLIFNQFCNIVQQGFAITNEMIGFLAVVAELARP
jgi:hypothetical protein